MTTQPPDASRDPVLPRRQPPKKPAPPVIEADELDDDALGDEDDEFEDDLDEDPDEDESDEEDDEESELEEKNSRAASNGSNAPKPNGSARGDESDADAEDESARAPVRDRRTVRRGRGPGGMGRPSTGPRQRAASRQVDDAPASDVLTIDAGEAELAPDISTWPGTAEAAKMVGRHTSTIKLWRTQQRIRAIQDASGCWRHHPDDLAEAINEPDATDPGAVLASGMTAIVSQGAAAHDRLITMTELSVDGLRETVVLLREELKRSHARNAELERMISAEREKNVATHSEDLKHERYMRRLDQGHAVRLAGAHETSERINGLLTMLGPIAASIGARLLGDITGAEKTEAQIAGAGSKEPGMSPELSSNPPKPVTEDRLVPLESRILDGMARLTDAIRKLDKPAFAGLRAMLPPAVAEALDAVVKAESDGSVGKALAVIIQAAQNLSDLQFAALRPIAPLDIATVLGELRAMLREQG